MESCGVLHWLWICEQTFECVCVNLYENAVKKDIKAAGVEQWKKMWPAQRGSTLDSSAERQ